MFPFSFMPITQWARDYRRATFIDDAVAALVITMMLIPQSLAYALLAGLPPQLGLYASILPLLIYAVFGSSGALSVGPFAISSIMTATALAAAFPDAGSAEIIQGAVVLALMSGGFLLLFGVLRLGFLSNFLSFPVVSGFISASAIVIATRQLGNLLGGPPASGPVWLAVPSLLNQLGDVHLYTLGLGLCACLLLWWAPAALKRLGRLCQLSDYGCDLLAKTTPILTMLLSLWVVQHWRLDAQGVAVLGDVPRGLPALALPQMGMDWGLETWKRLLGSALLISVIGFVSAVSVAQSFAAKRRQRIDPNQEAIGLGMANLAAGFSSAFPISASLSRSAVSFNAGAKTPAAGAFSALGVCLATVFVTPWLYYLPVATLAAMILLAVISLIDTAAIKRTARYSYKDLSAMAVTAALTLLQGVEWGLVSGVLLSIALHLYRSSHPHVAVLGKIPGTEHFRNPERHKVDMDERIISFRVDASLYFANARFLEDQVNALVAENQAAEHFVLMCSSINDIDASALESLVSIDQYLRHANMCFHLSEVKGPVLDRLKRSNFLEQMSGNLYVSHFQAWSDLTAQAQS